MSHITLLAQMPLHAPQRVSPTRTASGWLNGPLTPAGQNAGDPSSRHTHLACSSVDLLWVISYTPGAGDQGTPISVNFTCKADLPVGVHIRLVVGRRAVSTQVREIDAPGCGCWQLKGYAPSFSKQKSSCATVPLTIQAVNKENHILNSVTFGDFVYNSAAGGEMALRPVSSKYTQSFSFATSDVHSRSSRRSVSNQSMERSSKRQNPYARPQSPSSSDSEYSPSQSSQSRITTSHLSAQAVTPALRRAARQGGLELEDSTQTVVLDIITSLDSFCYDWEESELLAGRRLVRFSRLQDGNRLIVSAERIAQSEYDADDIVISCIYREETDSCCVTSVDIIHLLQRLVESDFEVDEKNRIRRNLEGLRPTTVSKTRPGFESFFQRIMDFPDPKPRKIEKDVKVFDWKLLPHALDKIISKYSLCHSPTTTSMKEEIHSPFLVTAFPREASAPSSLDNSPYGGSSSQLPGCPDPRSDTLQLSPVIQLVPFPPESRPDSLLEDYLYSPQESSQSVYVDSEIMQRYYRDPDIIYGMPPSSLEPQTYTVELSNALPSNTSTFGVEDQMPSDWATQPTDNPMLSSPSEPIYTYGYVQSDSAECIEVYATPQYSMNTYDSFEFQTLREHNISAVLASQVA